MKCKIEKLMPCPICEAEPTLCEDIQDSFVRCSDDCRAPRCEHTDPRHTACSWNDWVRWYRDEMTRLKAPHVTHAPEEKKLAYMLCPHCGQELNHIKIRTDTETFTLAELMARLKDLEEQVQSGRSSAIEDFPEDGLHPETEKVISEYLDQQ